MIVTHTVALEGPFDVNDANSFEIVDSRGSVVATTGHYAISEYIADLLTKNFAANRAVNFKHEDMQVAV